MTMIGFNVWMDIIQYVNQEGQVHIFAIAEALKVTYSHTHTLIKDLEGKGLITTMREGRRHNVKITKLGAQAAECIRQLRDVLEAKP